MVLAKRSKQQRGIHNQGEVQQLESPLCRSHGVCVACCRMCELCQLHGYSLLLPSTGIANGTSKRQLQGGKELVLQRSAGKSTSYLCCNTLVVLLTTVLLTSQVIACTAKAHGQMHEEEDTNCNCHSLSRHSLPRLGVKMGICETIQHSS